MPMHQVGAGPLAVSSRVYNLSRWLSFGRLEHPFGSLLFVGVGPYRHSCTVTISLGSRGILLPALERRSTNAVSPST